MQTKDKLLEILDENNKIMTSYVSVLNIFANIISSELEQHDNTSENERKEKTKKTKKTTQSTEKCEKPVLTLVDVRKVLVEKSREGYSDEIRTLLIKYGAEKLSEINPINYQILIDEALSLGATIEIIKTEFEKKANEGFSDKFPELFDAHYASSIEDLKKEYYSSFLRDLRGLGNE